MDFELTADQEALQDGMRKLCVGRFPLDQIRELQDAGGVDPALWQELVDAGVFSVQVAEDAGGVGLGLTEAVLVFEELGRALVPGPLAWTNLATALGVEGVGGVVCGVELDARRPLLVEHLGASDVMLVVDDEGVRAVAVEDVDGAHAVEHATDPLTPVWVLADAPEGGAVADAPAAARLRLEGATLAAAQLVGIAQATTDLAVAYAKERHQFDRPIGSFQAVKHILADMLVRAETARAAVDAAGVALDGRSELDVDRAVAVAKSVAGDAAIRNGESCIQVYGGMGFTWEADPHLFLKRAWALDTLFGSSEQHALRVADSL